MPRNTECVIIQVAVPKGSPILVHLRQEASNGKPEDSVYLGPYVYQLLIDRDAALYGGEKGGNRWYTTQPHYLQTLIEGALQRSLESLLPMLGSFSVARGESPEQATKIIEACSTQEAERLAADMLRAFEDEE